MFILQASKNKLAVLEREPVTSGSVNVYRARFEFSDDWEGLTRKAVFRAGKESRTVLLDETGACTVPWEVLAEYKPLTQLQAGVFGTQDDTVLPSAWASLGVILEGVTTGQDARPPTPGAWEQELSRKGDKLWYDGLNLSLMSGDKPLSTVQIAGGGGEGGVSDHRLLTGRDAEDQHPIEAIAGLKDALEQIPSIMTAEQLRKILMN